MAVVRVSEERHELTYGSTKEHFSKGHSIKEQWAVDDDRGGEEMVRGELKASLCPPPLEPWSPASAASPPGPNLHGNS